MKKIDKRTFKNSKQFLWKIIKPYRWWYVLIFQSTLISACYYVVNNYSIKLMIDTFSEGSIVEYSHFLIPVTLFILAQVGHDVAWRLSEFAIWHVEPYVHKAIFLKSYDYVQFHSYRYFQQTSSGEVISKLKGILDGYNNIFQNLHSKILQEFLTVLITIFSLLLVSTHIFMFMLIWSICVALTMYFIFSKLNKLAGDLAESKHQVMGIMSDNITNIFSLFYFAKRKIELKRLRRKIATLYIPNSVKLNKYYFKLNSIASLFYWFMLGSVFFYMVWLRKQEAISTGDFVFVMLNVVSVSFILWAFTASMFEFMKEIGDFKASFSILMKPHDDVDKDSSRAINIKTPTIQFKELSFKYDKHNVVFDHLNLTIPAGQKVGIVGRSGVGKSTLISLLLKNFLPTSGDILIGGHSIDDFHSDSLRSQVALIPQDIMLFHRSIGENIGYAKAHATLKEIKTAARMANIDTMIESLPEKYDTLVGERGIKLSGGQRQRVAIARAFLKNSSIVILDEATSSLDTATEQEVQESINQLLDKKNITLIAIAHRLSSIRHMDRIVVMDNGKIIEDGAFEQLITKKRGYFKSLWDSQANGMIV